MNHREEALGSAWTESAANLVRPRFWLTGIAFLAAYLALNVITVRYQFEALGITLWSPDDGLTVLLLIEGVEFFPFVLAGAVLADVLVSHVQHSFYVTVLAEFRLVSRLCGHRGRVARCPQVQPEAERSGRCPRDAGGRAGRRHPELVDLLRRPLSGRLIARGSVYLRAAPFLDRRRGRNHCSPCGRDGGVLGFIQNPLGLAERRYAQLVGVHC